MATIYAIVNNRNGKIYIGQTNNDARIKTHFSKLRAGKHDCRMMQADYKQFGDEAFSVRLIETTSPGITDDREAYWMRYFNTGDPDFGYNYGDPKAKKAEITDFPYYNSPFERAVKKVRFEFEEYESQTWKSAERREGEHVRIPKGERIRLARLARGMEYAEAERLSGIRRGRISDYELGYKDVPDDDYVTLCDIYGIKPFLE